MKNMNKTELTQTGCQVEVPRFYPIDSFSHLN